MYRDLERLTTTSFDVAIIGGGIYGAWTAWEASLRGLSVALIEQADFGGATSANSQKIIHGGLRYLQSMDLKRLRESLREGRILSKVAPHLVRQLPCMMPTYKGKLLRSKTVMRSALAVYRLVSLDRNAGISDEARRIPSCRILSRKQCLRLAPDVPSEGLTGAALWYEGQIVDSERLTLTIVRSAVEAGAVAANYLKAITLLKKESRVTGVRAVDQLTQRTVDIQARMVINAAGPWIDQAGCVDNRKTSTWFKVMNLVLKVPAAQGVALALPVPQPDSDVPGLLFITPWNDRTIVGSTYVPFEGDPRFCRITEDEIEAFIETIRLSYPDWKISRSDVERVHVGILPASEGQKAIRKRAMRKHYAILDEEKLSGIKGLITVLGVKYTTARDVAEKTVDKVCQKIGRMSPRGVSRSIPLFGGRIASVDALLDEALRERLWDLSASVIRQLVSHYGAAYQQVLMLIRENMIWAESISPSSSVIKAQIIYAIRHEMAQTLADVILRRTGLGAGGYPGSEAVSTCAELMAAELEWTDEKMHQEIEDVHRSFFQLGWRKITPAERNFRKPTPVAVNGRH